jgi:hypothetical protein
MFTGSEIMLGQVEGGSARRPGGGDDGLPAARRGEILSFNAAQLRMISASRKKTDRRDAYWIARALQTGLHPHPVYLPMGEIREL